MAVNGIPPAGRELLPAARAVVERVPHFRRRIAALADGRVALVTGAACPPGIGRATALRLARAGEVRLGAGNSAPRYERPNRGNQLPHEEVMAILNAVRSNP